jgi:hypothetical protein
MVMSSSLPANIYVGGESVTYHVSGEDDVALTAIFVPDRSDLADLPPGSRDDTRTGSLTVAKTALASPSRDATVTIRSELWHVVTIDDGGAFWVLQIKRSVGIERGNESFRMPSL